MSFTNLYYKRTAGTARACYVCYKPTTTVLATMNAVDFLYTCPGHLSDPGFASSSDGGNGTKAAVAAISAEEIAKVKAEWEEKQKKKLEQEKEKAKETENEKAKDKEMVKGADKGKDKDKPTSPKEASPSSHAPSSAPAPHERYILHRDFFAMRQNEHRRRRQAAQAKELAPRLPGAPRGDLA